MERETLLIPNISCGHCVKTITRELAELEGVARVDGDAATKEVTVEWASPASLEAIKTILKEINFPVTE